MGSVCTEMGRVVVASVTARSVWVLELLVLAIFESSLALILFISSSNASFATVYPSSRPIFIPFSTPSSNLSSNFLSKFRNNDFLPFSKPSSYARSHKCSRFSPSGVVAANSRNFLMLSVVAMVMKLKKESRVMAGACVSTCEVPAMISAVIGAVAVSPRLAAFGCFGCCFGFFFPIVSVCTRFP